MSSKTPGGSGRKRIAGDAARRRRQEEDSGRNEEATVPTRGAAEPEAPERSAPPEEPDADEASPSPEFEDPARARTRRVPLPPRETRWWVALVAVGAVAAVVFACVVGGRYLQTRGADTALAESHDDATSAAATAIESILSYDHQSLGADRERAQQLMTDSFRKEYGQLFSKPYCKAIPVQGECTVEGTFPEVVKRNKQQVKASVVDVAPMECGDDCSESEARVLMFVDQSTTTGGKAQAPVGNRAILTMAEHDGDWLVDGIAYV